MTLTDNVKEYLVKAKEKGVEGSSDETALVLPPQFSAREVEKFLDFIFLQGCVKANFTDMADTGIAFAQKHLDNTEELGAVVRLKMGFNYHFRNWIKKVFDMLVTVPINDLSPKDEELMGWVAYRALAKAQATVLEKRLSLVCGPPTVNHCNWCTNHSYCQAEWNKGWTSMSGVLGAVIEEDLAGCQIYEKLEKYSVGGMNRECHRRTCEGVKDSTNKISILLEEEEVINKVISELIKAMGIA
ncbi:hypothetical protein C8R43DRAFT_965247 [Mycena crocata]|nr:hypothetical protein C8R43DRAFT_965247 [Mycena crocata]